MPYPLNFMFDLYSGDAGLTGLTAVLTDLSGSVVASQPVVTSIVETAIPAKYKFVGTMPTGHDGYLSIKSGSTVKTILRVQDESIDANNPTAAEIADELDTRHGTGSWQRMAISATPPTPEPVPILGATLIGRAGYTFAPAPFELVGDDSAGWTQYVFSVKVDADKDDENNALILIRESNPSAGDDGMMRQNGRRPQSNADASISVNVAGGNTIVTVFITARGMNVPTSSGDGYAFSLVRWAGAVKEEIASGNMVVSRTASRDPVAP